MSPSPPEPLLAVRGLSTHFATRGGLIKPVDGVSFDIATGEIVGLVGESGSGKSMTGFSLLGLIDPPGRIVSGSVRFAGQELVGLPPAQLRALRGRRIAMVFQDPMATLNPVLTVGAQIRLAIEAHERMGRAAARARAAEVLGRVGIPDAARRLDAWPHQFSGGMRQRVAIAIALLHRPAQILVEIGALVRELGTALLWISHDLATVSALASRLLVMYAGRIVEDGPIAEVLRAPRHPYTRGLLGSMPQFAQPGERLAQITGTPPSLAALPSGCAFSPRCNLASPQCSAGAPERSEQGARGWRCHHPLTESPR
jgi:peptide/nickel transport system ATP-binding protein